MQPRWQQPYGLRPTLRQVMIVVVSCAMLSAVVVPFLKGGLYWIASIFLPLALPLLAALILLLDRPGLVKYWLFGLIASLFLPALIVWVDVLVVAAWVQGWVAMAPVVALVILTVVNLAGLMALSRVVKRWPRRCPECGRRSWLPIGPGPGGLRWCASCGFRSRQETAAARGGEPRA